MGALVELNAREAMATRWRRRTRVVVLGDDAAATMRRVSATAIDLVTDARPPIGEAVELRHPEAGTVEGRVVAHAADGVSLRLSGNETAVAFAVAAIAADMSRPRR